VTETVARKDSRARNALVAGPKGSNAPARMVILPPVDGKEISGVAFEAPLTVEVIDPMPPRTAGAPCS
jgi:hypothetical protein